MNEIKTSNNAPLIIFCYNRLNSLEKVIKSVQKNKLVHSTDIYLFSDGPKINNPQDPDKVLEVREYINSLENFSKTLHIHEHEENIGLANSIIFGINKVLEKHDSFIVLEDDLEVSSQFLNFMNKTLKRYEDEKNIWTVNGMGFNNKLFKIPKNYKHDTYFSYRNSSHGWASWKDRWCKAILDIEVLENEIFETNNQIDFNKGGSDLTPMLYSLIDGNIDSWSIRWSYTISKNNGVCVSPVNSYVSMISVEGTHIKNPIEVFNNDLNLSKETFSYPDEIIVDDKIARSVAKIFDKEIPLLLDENKEQKIEYMKYTKRNNNNNKVTALSTIPFGGAGKAAINSTRSIEQNTDISIELFTQYESSENKFVRRFSHKKQEILNGLLTIFNENIFEGNTTFSAPYPSLSFSDLDLIINNSDLIHLHWVPGYLSNEAISYLSHSKVPIVWTFHDINPLSGGCHYFHGCKNWEKDCFNCPQLKNNFDNFPMKVHELKNNNFNFKNITVIVLNNHFKNLIKKSPLFNDSKVKVIPNCVDTEVYKPLDSEKLKKKYDLPLDKKIILYAASYKSSIKGFKEFIEGVEKLNEEDLHILIVGNPPNLNNILFPYTFWANANEKEMVDAYNIADVTVVSSIEDNLPNILLESLSCGTPVVGFKIAGIKDNIVNDFNGYLADLGNIDMLSKAIKKIAYGPDLSLNCRNYAIKNFSFESHAKNLEGLYKTTILEHVNTENYTKNIPELFPELSLLKGQLENKILRNNNKWLVFFRLPIKTKFKIIYRKIVNQI